MPPKKRRVVSSSDPVQDDSLPSSVIPVDVQNDGNDNDEENLVIPISAQIRASRSRLNSLRGFESQMSPERQAAIIARIEERDARPEPPFPPLNLWKKSHNFATSKMMRLDICRRVLKKLERE